MARVDPRRRAADGRVGDGHPPLRRALPLAELHAQAHEGGLRDLLRHPLPRPRARGRAGRCASRAPTPGTASTAPPSARSRAGSGSTGTSRTPPRATRRCARGAGPGCTGRRRSAPSTAPRASAAALFDESSFAKLEVSGPGAAELLERLCDNRVARDVGAITYTQMLNRRGGIECDFTVTRTGEESVLDRHRHRLRRPRPRLDPPPRAGRRQRALRRRDRALGLLRAVGTAGARDPRAADRRPARLRLHAHARARGRRRPGARPAGDVRRRARLGAVLPDGVRRRPVAHAVGGRARARDARRRLPRDRLAAPGEGLPRVGGRHHRRRDAATRPGSASACKDGDAFIGRRGARAAEDAGARRAAPALPGARRPALGRARQRAGARRRGGRRAASPAAATATRWSARSPTRTCPPSSSSATEVEIDIFGQWVAGEVAREPLFDPQASASGLSDLSGLGGEAGDNQRSDRHGTSARLWRPSAGASTTRDAGSSPRDRPGTREACHR